jgi:hypothetical protein
MRSLLILTLLAISAPPALGQYYLPRYRYSRPDALQAQVASWYRKFLNREPDPAGLAGWVEGLRSGGSPERTLAGILGSAEYYVKSGSTPEGFIRTLYRDLLGRDPTEREMVFWLRRMYHQDRSDVAYTFLMRYPQSWQSARLLYERPEEPRYEYRRPFWQDWRAEYEHRRER